MLKKMHPEKAMELRETLKALRAKLHGASGEALKARKSKLHPALEAMKVRSHEEPMPNDEEPSRVEEMAEEMHKADEGHEGAKVEHEKDRPEVFAHGGEVPYPEKKERPAPPMPHYAEGGSVESDSDPTIEAHKKLLQRLLADY